MDADILQWLSSFSETIVRLSIVLFVVVNAVGLAAFAVRRDRSLVQRWTSPWLATNIVLIGTGIGTPLLVGLTKFAVMAFSGVTHVAVSAVK